MKLKLIMITAMVATLALTQEHHVYVVQGVIKCAPRELPSVGIQQSNGAVVLGLHGADDATRAACGWYRVERSSQQLATNQVVTGRSYTIGQYMVQEVLTIGERKVNTIEQRIQAVFDAPELQAMGADERVSAVIAAMAIAVTGQVDTAVSVIIPAKPKDAGETQK